MHGWTQAKWWASWINRTQIEYYIKKASRVGGMLFVLLEVLIYNFCSFNPWLILLPTTLR